MQMQSNLHNGRQKTCTKMVVISLFHQIFSESSLIIQHMCDRFHKREKKMGSREKPTFPRNLREYRHNARHARPPPSPVYEVGDDGMDEPPPEDPYPLHLTTPLKARGTRRPPI
ncbi:hypothetical protein Pcinc_042619 [Petrolisthes cinctipes]|uniref:Uncharacterized protein n=1 Tax=Petrolisthes cinctipes TaxID=88211 RepID=A0AAE1EFT9_PETCI|nr:hypothetical protein Pcinc_042619 [Petrolisthes cinctipes]